MMALISLASSAAFLQSDTSLLLTVFYAARDTQSGRL
jgi:hypothetical protein